MDNAYAEFFAQAVVGIHRSCMLCSAILYATCHIGYFPMSSLLSTSRTVHKVDFLRVSREELLRFEIPFSIRIDKTGLMLMVTCV